MSPLSPSASVSPSSATAAASASPLRAVLATSDDAAALVARLVLGGVMLPHGLQKALGWFGGYGFSGTMGFFTGTLGIPAVLAFLVIAAEFAGSLGLIVGLGSRVAALGIGATMIGATLLAHVPNGFFMNWTGAQKGEGFEYHILALGLALIVLVRGGGKASLDRALTAAR